ncbi:MAG: hypothetical protein ABIO95_09515 [Bdellovibrionota bacterium]
MKFLKLIGVVVFLSQCGGGASSSQGLAKPFFQTATSVAIEVFYEPGAEPFTGSTAGGLNYWDITLDNIKALLQYRSRVPLVSVPKDLASMTQIPDQARALWSTNDILALHKGSSSPSASGRVLVSLYFLDGNYAENGQAQTSVLGVSISGSSVIAIFKDVVRHAATDPSGVVAKYVEQSTIVHEFGHAVGLVNNGVPMKNDHEDAQHPHHTTDSDCVMYWLNEGASDMASFVARFIASGDTVMWGPDILDDAAAFSR